MGALKTDMQLLSHYQTHLNRNLSSRRYNVHYWLRIYLPKLYIPIPGYTSAYIESFISGKNKSGCTSDASYVIVK